MSLPNFKLKDFGSLLCRRRNRGYFFHGKLAWIFPLVGPIVFHDFAHIGFDVARGVERLGANDALAREIEGVELDGETSLERDEVEAALPLRGQGACAFGRDGQFEMVLGRFGALGQLVGQARLATALHGHTAKAAEEAAHRPEEPFALHQESCAAADAVVVEFGNDEVPVAGVRGYADDTFILVGNGHFNAPAAEGMEEEFTEFLPHNRGKTRGDDYASMILRLIASACAVNSSRSFL